MDTVVLILQSFVLDVSDKQVLVSCTPYTDRLLYTFDF